MANPAADFPAAAHASTDVSALAASYLGASSPTHVAVHGKVEEELEAITARLLGAPFNVKEYGAAGDGTTDDTDAVQAAIDAALAVNGTVYLPPGDFLVTALTLDDDSVTLKGAGINATRILTASAGPAISLGTFDSTPANPYIGTVDSFAMRDLTIQNVDDTGIAHVGVDQTSIGLQDNGCGEVTLSRVGFKGLLYGVYAPYGHDICTYYDVQAHYCTTSLYFGPGSQQINIFGGRSGVHGRAIVIDGAQQGAVYGFTFCDPKTRDIDLLCPDTLESGVTGLYPSAQLSWSFNDCWFETGAFATSWGPKEHIRVGATGDTYEVADVVIRNANLVSGSTGMAAHGAYTYAFVNVENGKRVLVDRILVSGDYIESVVTYPAESYKQVTVKDRIMVAGYTNIPAFVAKESNSAEVFSFWEQNATLTGAKGGNEALANLIVLLRDLGIIGHDSTS